MRNLIFTALFTAITLLSNGQTLQLSKNGNTAYGDIAFNNKTISGWEEGLYSSPTLRDYSNSTVAIRNNSTPSATFNRKEKVYKAQSFGIKANWNGTSGTDDRFAIQKALETINAEGGGTLDFEGGTCLVTDPIFNKSNIKIANATFYKPSTSSFTFIFYCGRISNIEFNNVTFTSVPNRRDPRGRNGATSNIQAIMLKQSRDVTLKNITFDGVHFGLKMDGGGQGRDGMTYNVTVEDIRSENTQEPLYISFVSNFTGKNWHLVSPDIKNSDVLNHQIYLYDNIEGLKISDVYMEGGAGYALAAGGNENGLKFENLTFKNVYGGIAANAATDNMVFSNVKMDGVLFSAFGSYGSGNITVENFDFRNISGTSGSVVSTANDDNGTITFRDGVMDAGITETKIFTGWGTNTLVFDNVRFNDCSQNDLFFTNLRPQNRLEVKNCTFHFKKTAVLPVIFDLRNTKSSLIENNQFLSDIVPAPSGGTFIAYNKGGGDHRFKNNKIKGYVYLVNPLDNLSKEENTSYLFDSIDDKSSAYPNKGAGDTAADEIKEGGTSSPVSLNASFEEDMQQWYTWFASPAKGDFSISTDVALTGRKSLLASGVKRGAPFQLIDYRPGKYYAEASCYVPDNYKNGTVDLVIQALDNDNRVISTIALPTMPISLQPGKWSSVKVPFTLPISSEAKRLRLVPTFDGFTPKDKVYLDDIGVFKIN